MICVSFSYCVGFLLYFARFVICKSCCFFFVALAPTCVVAFACVFLLSFMHNCSFLCIATCFHLHVVDPTLVCMWLLSLVFAHGFSCLRVASPHLLLLFTRCYSLIVATPHPSLLLLLFLTFLKYL